VVVFVGFFFKEGTGYVHRSVDGPLNAVVQMQFGTWEFASDWEAWGRGAEEGGRMTFAC